MPSEVKYEEQKHCCTSCAMKRRCHVCDQPTTLACSDCAIDLRAVIYVCNKTQCRDEHEKKCAHSLQSQLDAKWISVDVKLPPVMRAVLTTDGKRVTQTYRTSHDKRMWGAWAPDQVTFWQPLPPPPSGAKGETKP